MYADSHHAQGARQWRPNLGSIGGVPRCPAADVQLVVAVQEAKLPVGADQAQAIGRDLDGRRGGTARCGGNAREAQQHLPWHCEADEAQSGSVSVVLSQYHDEKDDISAHRTSRPWARRGGSA